FIYNKRGNLSDSAVKFVDSVFLKHFINEISGKKINDRLKISGIEPTRADIILSAAILAGLLMNRYQLDGFYTLSGGLRAGLTIDLMNKTGIEMMFQGGNADVRYTRLIETGKKYYFDERHALQTARLAKILFDNLKTVMGLEESDWSLLEAAAILHDTGQHIAYAKHHKHSYYLIMNTELPGFSDEEKTVIANIARYHRRSMPKKTHENLQNISADARVKIEKLSAIMRAADALDRTHGSIVKDIKVTVHDKTAELEIIADGDTSMEINGLNKKKDLLEKILDREVTVI
ncbi:MAG: HD domain-containing protein, partial [Mucispirillum sp.]|nr:HD domain-containing protein [Mucispirillum sp.]